MTEQRPTLPWGDYVSLLEHTQLGDYGGECKLRTGIICQPCRDAGADFVVVRFFEYLPMDMVELLGKITEHERERHGRSWMEIR